MHRGTCAALPAILAGAVLAITGCGGGGGSGPRSWTAEEPVDTFTGSVRSPQVGMDADGNAIAVFDHDDGLTYHSLANRFVRGEGWGLARPVETGSELGGDAVAPVVAVSANGTALAAWRQSDGARSRIFASTFLPDLGWGMPELIDSVGDGSTYSWGASDPLVAINDQGDALAVWEQTDNADADLLGARYVAGQGWQAPVVVAHQASAPILPQGVAIDSQGNGLAIWIPAISQSYRLWGARFEAQSGWSPGVELQSGTGVAWEGRLAMNAAGVGLVGFEQWDGTRYLVQATRYLPGTGWEAPQVLAPGTLGQGQVQVAVDRAGNGTVVFTQWEAGRGLLFSCRRPAKGSWEAEARVDDRTSGDAVEATIGVDSSGNVVGAWIAVDAAPPRNIQAARWTPGSGWSPSVTLTDGVADAITPSLAVAPDGTAVVVWIHHASGQSTVWSSRYE